MKMAPKRKPVALPEKLVAQEKTKVAPTRDIEDLIKAEPTTSGSSYFSPIQTRNQRLTKALVGFAPRNKIKPTSSLASQEPNLLKDVAEEKPKKFPVKEAKKTKEMKTVLEDTKKLPEIENSEEVLIVEPIAIVKPVVVKSKKVTKPKVVKTKKLPLETLSSTKALKSEERNVSNKEELLASPKKEKLLTSPKKEKLRSPTKTEADLPSPKKEELLQSPVKTTKRKSKDLPKSPDMKQDKWEPNNWTEILDNIRAMRASSLAPVDTMGCDKCSDDDADEKTRRFHVLLALMLSSQTKDEVTHEAMKRLRETNCTPRVIADMETQKLESLLYPVSFYKNKAKYLKNTSKILVDDYDSDIPNDIKGLIKLPGVGPKMAHICMSAAWDIVTGIGVDVHVHRISNRLGWVRQETKQPEQTRKELESWLPSTHWKEVNHLLVGFGQTICTPTKPKCGECLNKGICPSAFVVKPKKVKAEKVIL